MFVFVETGSGAATAILFVCQLGPAALLGPIAGTIVDRVDLRRCLIATNLAQAVALLPLLAVTADRVWPAYLVVAAQAPLTQLNNPANVSILTRVVTDARADPRQCRPRGVRQPRPAPRCAPRRRRSSPGAA